MIFSFKHLTKHFFKTLLVFAVFVITPLLIGATHLVGGNIGYEYVGIQGDGTYRYRITATTYTNCGPDSNVPDPEPELEIGIYANDLSNPNADKILTEAVTVLLISQFDITPDLPDGCTVGFDVCLTEGNYEAFVDLPVNIGGYWLFYQRCCRNEQIVNLDDPGSQGVGFTALMPSPLVNNSSPYFTEAPTPFLCANDTSTFLNTAIDPDGDQLIFSFITVGQGYSTPALPNPGPPDPLFWPLPTINWNGGFNVSQPFGAAGYAFINGATGLTSYMAPMSGQYVVGVEIKEYRNGNLIGQLTRDLQLLVLDCPPNPAPNLTAINNGETEFTVLEGDTLCFPIQFEDLNGDSLLLTSAGQIFDVTFTSPVATINTPIEDEGLVTADFCWFTSCDQGQNLPYQITTSVTDNGCPPKTTSVVYQITVVPFTGSSFINGNPNPCEEAEYTYSTDDFMNASYNWVAMGGSVTSGQGTNEISVEWDSSGAGSLTVIATDERGCIGDPFDLNINIQALPAVDAGTDIQLCLGDTISIGGAPTGPGGATFLWSPTDSISDVNDQNPQVYPSESTDYIVQVVTAFSCTGEDTINVQVNIPMIDAGIDVTICEGDTIQLNGMNATTYSWSPGSFLSDDGIADPEAFPMDTTIFFVTGPDVNTCVGVDSVTVFVAAIPNTDAGPDTIICGLEYNMQAIPSVGEGIWRPQANATYVNETEATTIVSVTTEGTYTFNWVEGNFGCQDSAEVTIQFISQPIAQANPDDSICGLVFDLNAFPSVGIGTWTFPAGVTPSGTNSDPVQQVTADNYQVYSFQWKEENNGCVDSTIFSVDFIEQPIVNAGVNDSICGLEYELGAIISAGTGTWISNDGVFNPNENDPFATVSFPDPGIQEIIWTAENDGFCIAIDTVLIDFQEIPTAEAGVDQSFCGLATNLEGETTGIGTWTSDVAISFDDLNDPLSQATSSVYNAYTIYWNTVLGNCVNEDSVSIEFMEVPIANAGADTPICFGDEIGLNGSLGDNYLWTPNEFISDNTIANPFVNPDETTTYFLEVSLDNGCISVDSVTIFVNVLPIVDAGEDIGYLCDGDSIQLNATLGWSSYSWQPAGDVSDPSIPNPFAIGDFTADYIITVMDVNNCAGSDTINIVVNGVVPTDAGPDQYICLGDSVQLGGAPSGPDGTTYLWTPANNISDTLDANPFVNPSIETEYILETTNSICNGMDTVRVFMNSIISPNFEFFLVPECDGLRANFLNLGDDEDDYNWNFGDGLTSLEFSPTHEYAFNNEYTVTLSATSTDGCIEEASKNISSEDFDDYFQVFAPNVFTPNGDGENDIFDINIQGNISECLEFQVFNRWGEAMFISYGNNTRWDGYTNGGVKVSPGVYFYIIEINGKVLKGDVQVLY